MTIFLMLSEICEPPFFAFASDEKATKNTTHFVYSEHHSFIQKKKGELNSRQDTVQFVM